MRKPARYEIRTPTSAQPGNALEWDSCKSLTAMMSCLDGQTSERKLRLFATACCRRIWHLFTDPRTTAAVCRSEQLADQQVRTPARLVRADWMQSREDLSFEEYLLWRAAKYAAQADTRNGALTAADAVQAVHFYLEDREFDDEEAAQCDLLRDIMGNPFAPLLEDPSWVQAESIQVAPFARSVYATRGFSKLPALADEMERTGCRDQRLVEHCRRGGEHARGCWVLDTILGRHEGAVVIRRDLLPMHLRVRQDRQAHLRRNEPRARTDPSPDA